jgi:hypothetical protein
MTRSLVRSSSMAVVCCALSLSTACAGGTSEDAGVTGPADHRALVPTPPEEGLGKQFVASDLVIPVGEERMTCWVPDWVPDRDYLVTRFEGVQSPLGHHVVALRSGIDRDPGTVFDCTDLESMVSLEPLVLPDPTEETRLLPEGYAVRLPAGSRIVIQSHYVNYTDEDIVTADVARFTFVPLADEGTITEVSYLIANHGALVVDEGVTTKTIGCALPTDVNVLALLGHMHGLGKEISVTRTPASGVVEVLYDEPAWTVEFRDVPPLELFPASAPLILAAGDQLRVSCTYDNDTGAAVGFPEEMCTAVGYYFPAQPDGIIFCDDVVE